MQRMTIEEFAKFISRSKQLIAYYSSKGMPKIKEGRVCKYDASECCDWARENGYINFAHQIHSCIVNNNIEKDKKSEIFKNIDKIEDAEDAKHDATNYPPNFEDFTNETEIVQHGEGSTAEPIQIKVSKIEKLKNAFDTFIACLEDVINDKEVYSPKKKN